MGCSTSAMLATHTSKRPVELTAPSSTPTHTEDTVLSSRQKTLVRSSWQYMTTRASSAAIGKQIFLSIFEVRPAIKQLFPFRSAWGDELLADPAFVAHTVRFGDTIERCVRGLDELEGAFGRSMHALGAQHADIGGLDADYFEVMHRSTLIVWQNQPRDQFNEEVLCAWARLLRFLVVKVRTGYEDALSSRNSDAVQTLSQPG